jgi:hypothetical protein
MAIKLIEMDSEWKGGNYVEQPKEGTGAILSLMFMVSSPHNGKLTSLLEKPQRLLWKNLKVLVNIRCK